jgi:hypothetical protein
VAILDKGRSNNVTIFSLVVIINFVFIIISTASKNYMWLIPSVVITIGYLIYYLYTSVKNGKINYTVYAGGVGGGGGSWHVDLNSLEILSIGFVLILLILSIAAIIKGDDPGMLYKETLDTVKDIFVNRTSG